MDSNATSPVPHRVVVVGNGMVSHRFCLSLARLPDFARRFYVTVLGEESLPAYDRTRLSEVVGRGGGAPLLADRDWYEGHGIALELGTRVVEIDTERRSVRTADERSYAYDALVLATGSRAYMAPIDGIESPGVHVYRTVEDVRRIVVAARAAKRCVVVGGGLLGLEAAHVLDKLGLEVEVVENGKALMPRQLDAASGMLLDRRVVRQGIRTRLGRRLERIRKAEPAGSGLTLEFRDNEPLTTDLVVVATGIRARDELARQSGLRVAVRGGFVVDDHLCTSAPDVYAIGECASHRGTQYGLIAPGYEMADVLAARLGGSERTFPRGDESCELKLLGIPVATAGLFDREARHVAYAAGDARRTLMLSGRRLIGATCVGSWPQLARVRDAAMRETTLTRWQLRRFRSSGNLWDDATQDQVAAWPARTIICNCARVDRGTLSQCVARGATDVASLREQTAAGTVCGSCTPLLAQLVGRTVEPSRRGHIAVLVASVALLLIAALMGLVGPLPIAESVEASWHRLNELWRDPFSKQVTGFTLVGLSLLSLLLTARKRLRWFKLGHFGSYRAWHTGLACAALALTVLHTGMHFGANVNLALMASFLGLAIVGAFAGLATVAEAGGTTALARSARRARPLLTATHIVLLWPLPVLLGLHVFAAYYF